MTLTPLNDTRILWRLQGPTRVLMAVIADIPTGYELRIGFEPDPGGELLLRDVGPATVLNRRRLRRRAQRVARALRREGFRPLPLPERDVSHTTANPWHKVAMSAAIALTAAVWAGNRRIRRAEERPAKR